MRLQIISDLHLELHAAYTNFEFIQTAPNLVLLGDIGHVQDKSLFIFLEHQLRRYELVFFLLGNHEPYHMRLENAKSHVRSFAARMDQLRQYGSMGSFVFLDKTRYEAPEEQIIVLGCTLFSKIISEQGWEVQKRLVDFRDIIEWDVWEHNEAHSSDLGWLNEQVLAITSHQPDKRIIIFTHHSPCVDRRANDPRHANSSVSSGFVTDLSGEACWTDPAVIAWAFGHTHFNCDFTDDSTGKRVIANQKGYLKKLPSIHRQKGDCSFDAGKVFNFGA